MDQLKPYLKALQDHWFWFSCLAICLLTGVMWFLSTGSLKASFSKDYQTIKSKISEAQQLASEQAHPNDVSREGMQALIDEQKRSVRTAWQKQYNEQGEEIFVWPDGLKESFRNKVKEMRPIEALGYPPTKQLDIGDRSDYANFIKRELPKLAEIIGANWGPNVRGGAGSGPTSAPKEEEVVKWNASNQEDIQSKRFDWSKAENRVPTTLELLYAQEDYWVLKSLMLIIRDTNQGAVSPQQKEAVIRRLDFVEIGKDARAEVGSVMRLSGQPGASSAPADPSMAPPPDPAMADPGAPSPTPGDPAAAPGNSPDPAHLRYVDKNYKRLTAAELRAARSAGNNPDQAYLAVAKRMPVRLRVRINQLAIPRLLVACANADLTVEVRQVRVNRPPGMVSGGGRSGTASRGSSSSSGSGDSNFPWDVDVEIYGIVYIYNPVDDEKLKYSEKAAAAAPAPGVPEVPVPPGGPDPAIPTDPAIPPTDPAAVPPPA